MVMRRRRVGRAGCVARALLLDQIIGDPRSPYHPVAVFGRTMERYERRFWKDSKLSGAIYTLVGCTLSVAAGAALERVIGGGRALLASTCIASASKSLLDTAGEVGRLLEAGRLEDARVALGALVGRECASLDSEEIARAVIESVGENLSDAVVGSVVWAMILGARGVVVHRAVNTMDAMVGHKSARFERFGWASARLDDVMGLPVAYATALMVIGAAPGRTGQILRSIRYAPRSHPSYNARTCEAAFAGALGIELGGSNRYGDRVEDRGRIGSGRRASPEDIDRAVELGRRVVAVTTLVLLVIDEVTLRSGKGKR